MLATTSTQGVVHAGFLTALREGLVLENAPGQQHFRLVRRSMRHSDGSTVFDGLGVRTRRTLGARPTDLLDLPSTGMFLVGVTILGPFYEQDLLLLVTKGASIGGGAGTVFHAINYDPPGAGPKGFPVFDVDGMTLTVTNANFTADYTCDVSLTTALSDTIHPAVTTARSFALPSPIIRRRCGPPEVGCLSRLEVR
jgi:hypothetical protein